MEEAESGEWMVMEVMMWLDGDSDIILGSFRDGDESLKFTNVKIKDHT
jgi:hypothetical protein